MKAFKFKNWDLTVEGKRSNRFKKYIVITLMGKKDPTGFIDIE